MYIINSNFTILKQIGDLSPTRISALKEAFREFPEFITPQPQVVIFKKGTTHLIISQTQIILAMQADSNEFNFEKISQYLTTANEVLGLSPSSVIVVNIEGTEDTRENILEKSKEINIEVSSLLNATGIGLRFIIDKENYNGELKIEPFLQDNQKYFIQALLQSKHEIEAEKINSYLSDIFNYEIAMGGQAAKKIFSL